MESQSTSEAESAPSINSQTLVSFYSSAIINRFRSILPAATSFSSTSLSYVASSSKRPRRRNRLPLPLPSTLQRFSAIFQLGSSVVYQDVYQDDSFIFGDTCTTSAEAFRICDALDDIFETGLHNLQIIQKHLEFWKSKKYEALYYMICQRGPRLFLDGAVQVIRECFSKTDDTSGVSLKWAASVHVSIRITFLTSLKNFLATFLSEFYMEVDRIGDEIIKNVEKLLPCLLVAITNMFLKLEASIDHFHANQLSYLKVEGTYPPPLTFARFPQADQEVSQLTDSETKDAINLIYENLQRLESYLSVMVSKHSKPRKATLN